MNIKMTENQSKNLIVTLITTGPPGALIGEVLIMRKAKAILVASESVMPSVSTDY